MIYRAAAKNAIMKRVTGAGGNGQRAFVCQCDRPNPQRCRSAAPFRRCVRSRDAGDLTTMDDPAALQQIRTASPACDDAFDARLRRRSSGSGGHGVCRGLINPLKGSPCIPDPAPSQPVHTGALTAQNRAASNCSCGGIAVIAICRAFG
jgi:hypothetical protein